MIGGVGHDPVMTTPISRARSILVVDDDATVRRAIRALLVEELAVSGHVIVDEASSAMECLAILSGRLPALVLLDVRMADSHGFDLLAQIRRRHPSVSVVIVSGLPADPYAVHAMRAGATGYVEKFRLREELLPLARIVIDAAVHAVESGAA